MMGSQAMADEALLWVIRTRDPDFTDWEAFTLWLERDARHAGAYDAMMARDAGLDALVPPAISPPPLPANDAGAPRRRWGWIAGGAIAAGLVATLSLGLFNRTDIYTVATRPGETRIVALEEGTRVEMNGATTMRFDRKDARFAALDGGEAVFTVRHDARDPFRVTVGNAVFEDAGTVFNIVRERASTRIGVSEGEVVYNPQGEAISLKAGRALIEDASGLHLMAVDTRSIASWRDGRLVYANAPVAQIAQDIARSLDVRLTTTPGARAQRFTGTIRIDRDPVRFFRDAAPLLGLSAHRDGNGWVLKEGDGTVG
ncbi:MAG: FecR domain-containing protein [Sphingobium sp.]